MLKTKNQAAGVGFPDIPPTSKRNKDKPIFSQEHVQMRGGIYYLRLFMDGYSEFVTYDEPTGKWIFLHFPPEANIMKNNPDGVV